MGRTKNERVSLRLTKEEKDSLLENAQKAKMSLSEYLLTLNKHKQILIIESAPDICRNIIKIGININQIAKNSNSSKIVSKEQIDRVQSDVETLKIMLSNILNEIYNAKDNVKI